MRFFSHRDDAMTPDTMIRRLTNSVHPCTTEMQCCREECLSARVLSSQCRMWQGRIRFSFLPLVILLFFITITTAAPTTEIHVVHFAPDGNTILDEKTIDYQWMEANLPVHGDGITHYYHQGPVFVESKEGQWDVQETLNFKDMGAVKGTDIRDLCDLVGGMAPGDEVMVKAVDGYHVEFTYENMYHPSSRQGPAVVCWFNGDESKAGERQGVGYPPSYHVGMRLVFFADNSTNREGKHVFGNTDMREVMPAESIHLFDNLYPSTSGYTVKWVDEIRVYSGGYHGSPDALPKSYESKMDETYPPPPTKSAVPPLDTMIAVSLAGSLLILRRCALP